MLLRLQTGGVEARLRDSSYGFRARRSTTDAIFIAKRLIEAVLATKGGKISILMLDWAKAFDRISQSAMLSALARFGIPHCYIEAISEIYSDRTFQIKDGGGLSSTRGQARGIAQGCPLSPYLFIIMLSVILEDADVKSQDAAAEVVDTTYADDTMLASSSIPDLQIYLSNVIEIAEAYGLKPNWKKTKHLQIGHGTDLYDTIGEPLTVSQQEVYLGSLVTCSGRATASINRRLGEARSSFMKVKQIWQHANITKHRKVDIYMSCIVSKLLYSLDCETLRLCDRRRIDAFHCRCLRSICRIPHSMLSHVSNAAVLETAGVKALSAILAERQLTLFGRIASLPDTSILRATVFSGNVIAPRSFEGVRCRGRPRVTWASTQHAKALQLFGGSQVALNMFFNQPNADNEWRKLVSGNL